jgi:hypothetical protein
VTTSILDYSYARPPVSNIAAVSIGAMRYLGGDSRCITAYERDQLLGAGLGIGLIWELEADRVLDGHAAGFDDAQEANWWANSITAPGGTPIYYATDFGANDAQIAGPIEDYYRGALEAGGRPVRVYGGAPVIDHMHTYLGMSHGWQAAAASWSDYRLSPHASMLQEVEQLWGGQADTNIVLCPDTGIDWLWGWSGGDEMTDEDWARMTGLLNTMIVGKLAMHTSPSALLTDAGGQFTVVMTTDGPRRYIFGSPAEVTMASRIGLIVPQKPQNPPEPCPTAFDVADLSQAERDVLYGYPVLETG